MPYCPNCKAEYRDGFSICSDCNIELVNNLKKEEESFDKIQEEFVLLTRAHDSIHTDLIENLLKEHNIPTSNSTRTHLDVIMGNSSLGREIFVPKSFLNKAKQIIEKIDANLIEKNDSDHTIEDKYDTKYRTWIILWLFYIPGIIVAVIVIIYLIVNIIKLIFN